MEVSRLLWDDHNIEHIARHHVTPAEAEQVVFGRDMKGPYVDNRYRAGRLLFFGRTSRTRALVVVTDVPTPTGEAYVVTARPLKEKERLKYLEAR